MRLSFIIVLSIVLLAACAANLTSSSQDRQATQSQSSQVLIPPSLAPPFSATSIMQSPPALTLSATQQVTASPLPTSHSTLLSASPVPRPAGGDTLPVGYLFYRCTTGLCLQTLGGTATRTVVALPSGMTEQQQASFFHGYTLSPDGTRLVYAIDAPDVPWGSADIYWAASDQLIAHKLFRVKGALNGAGDPEGFGVLGFSSDQTQIIFEDQAQVFVAQLDGTQRRAITPLLGYGASTTHYFALSPHGTRLLVRTFGNSPAMPIYTVATGTVVEYVLDHMLAPTAFLDDERVLALQLATAYNEDMGEVPNSQRPVIGYKEVWLPQGTSQSISLNPGTIDAISSNGSLGFVVVQQGVGQAKYFLFEVASGRLTPIKLIDALGKGNVAIVLTAPYLSTPIP